MSANNYDEFIRRIGRLGKELNVSPGEAMVLFGHVARGVVEFMHQQGDTGMTHDQLLEDALNRYASGLGTGDTELSFGDPAKGLH